MKGNQDIKEELEKELNQVNIRLEILDMIEDRLLQMKELIITKVPGKTRLMSIYVDMDLDN